MLKIQDAAGESLQLSKLLLDWETDVNATNQYWKPNPFLVYPMKGVYADYCYNSDKTIIIMDKLELCLIHVKKITLK